MSFNIFNGFFSSNNVSDNTPLHPKSTFIQQTTKCMWIVGNFFSIWSTLNIISSSVSDDKTNDAEPELPTSSRTCAIGLFAFSTGQPTIQLAGLPLLSSCFNYLGVQAYESNATFLSSIGAINNITAYSVQQTYDGGYIVSGQTLSEVGGNWDCMISKLATNGSLLWSKTWGGGSAENAESIQQTPDGGIIVTGVTYSSGAGGSDLFLAKFTTNGSIAWINTVGGTGDDYGKTIQVTQDGGVIVIGYTYSFGAGLCNLFLSKFTSSGVLSWAKTIGGLGTDRGHSVQQTQSGEFIVTGYTYSFGAGLADILLAKLSTTGTLLWTKTLGGANIDVGNSIQETQDGGIIISGYTTSFGAGTTDLLVAKLSSSGTLLWAKALGGTYVDVGNTVQETQDGGFVITGYTYSFGVGGPNILLAKFTSAGTLAWAKILGKENNEIGRTLQKTQDGGFIIAGISKSNMLVAKLDENGNIAHCYASKTINPTVIDITALLTVNSPAVTVTTPSPTILNWTVSAISQHFNQSILCPGNSSTASISADKTSSISASHDRSLSASHSPLSHSDSKSISQIDSLSDSLSYSLHSSRTGSKILSESQSLQVIETRTKQATRTRPVRRSTSVLIQESSLTMTGVTQTQLSPSGSLILTKTETGLQFITVSREGTMTPAGQIAVSGTIQATTFSQDEKTLFVANSDGNIQVIDIHDPTHPRSLGFVSTGTLITSLAISGDGTQLLVGTNTGINVLSTHTPIDPKTMTVVTSYPTTPVATIQTNPNTNVVSIGSGKNVTLLDFKNNQFTKLSQTTLAGPIISISPIDLTDPDQLTLKLSNGDTVVLNISNSTSVEITSTLVGSTSTLTAISGATLLVAGVKPGIQIFESVDKNWQKTPEAGYTPVTGTVTSLSFSSDGKFGVYTDAQGLKLIKVIRDPGRLDVPLPRLLNIVKLGFSIPNILLNEESQWIAIGGEHLTIISSKNLQLPKVLGNLNLLSHIQQMVFFPDKTKLLLVDEDGVAYVDCFDPTTPRLLGRWNTPNAIYGLTLSGSYAYASQGELGISVLDITNPLNIIKTATLSTQGAAQSIQFNRAHSLAYVADSAGIDIWSTQNRLMPQRISRLNTTGFVSTLALSQDEKSLYFVSEQLLGQVNVSSPTMPILSNRLETTRPINNIILSNQDAVAYLSAGTDGLLIVDTKTMQIKNQLASSSAQSIALSDFEDEIYIADMEGGLKVAELINELPIIPLTATTHYPVGIRVEETLLFFNKELQRITVDRINSIQYIENGQKRDLPLWISTDLIQRKISITAPKELTDQSIQLAISVDINGAKQETVYQTIVASSLDINPDKGVITITTPSPMISVGVRLNQARFIPLPSGTLSVSSENGILQVFGPVEDVNHYLQSIRIIPDPITLNPSEVVLNSAKIRATDMVNLFPSNAIVRLRHFRFNQPPVVVKTMNQTNVKALTSFDITVPPSTFNDPDDPKLILSAQLINGSNLPYWLTFNQETGVFNGIAPASMLNKTLPIKLTASDGYLSVNSTWILHINANQGPFLAKPAPAITRVTGAEFSYTIPANMFQDLDNNTLTLNAVQEGYTVLPGFLNFNPETQTFLGRPTSGDVQTYTIKITATDKFGASAEATFDINIKFSGWDFFLYFMGNLGIATASLAPFTWAYYKQAFIYNTARRENYWREEIPKALLEGKGYKPKHPTTETDISKDDIKKIHIMAINKDKLGHDFARDRLPLHLYVSQYANPLLNDEPLPNWMTLDPDTGELNFCPVYFPTEDNTYVYQVIGEDGFILESFFIKPSQITMYQAPTLLISSPNSITLDQSQANARPNVWADLADSDHELEEILNQRPGNDAQPHDSANNISPTLSELLPEQPAPQTIPRNISIDLTELLINDENNSQPPHPETSRDRENIITNREYSRFFEKSFVSTEAKKLNEALGGEHYSPSTNALF